MHSTPTLLLLCALLQGAGCAHGRRTVSPPVQSDGAEQRCNEAGLQRISVVGASIEIVRFAETYEEELRDGVTSAHPCAGEPAAACEAAAMSAAQARYPNATDIRVRIQGDANGFVAELEVDGQSVTLHRDSHDEVAAHLRELSDAGHDVTLHSVAQEFDAESAWAQVTLVARVRTVHQPGAELRVTPTGESSLASIFGSLNEAFRAEDFDLRLVEPNDGFLRVRVGCGSGVSPSEP